MLRIVANHEENRLQGIDISGLTFVAWALAALTGLVVLLLLAAALSTHRALRRREAELAAAKAERAEAERQAAERVAHAEEHAIHARARVEQLLQLSQLGRFEWDVASGRLDSSGAFASLLGYAAHEMAPHIDAWLRLVHPEDLPLLAPWLEQGAADAAQGLDCELRLRNAAGAWQWVRAAAQVVERDAAGAPRTVVGLQHDIGAQKRAEATLEAERRLFDHGPVIPLTLDLEPPHALRDASRSLQRARGCDPDEPLPIGADLSDLLHREDVAALQQAIARLNRGTAGGEVQREVRLLRANGRWCWYLLHLAIERREGAVLRGYLVDIERLKEAESRAASQSGDLQQVVQRMSSTQRFLQSVQQMTELLQLSESEGDARAIVAQAGPELFPRWSGAVT